MLKARWINKLNKKGAGSYKDGKYDVDEILRCLDKAMQSNADNTIVNHTDDNGATHDNLGWDEPVDYSPLFSVSGMNSGYMATKMLYDNLTNFAGKGVEDPRADHILPWARSVKSDNSPAEI
jgi:arylsulfatase A-like enzyme